MALPELARQYGILGTPHTVLNGRRHLRGSLSEGVLLEAILALAGPSDDSGAD